MPDIEKLRGLPQAVDEFVRHVTENGELDTAATPDGCIGLAAWVGGCATCLHLFDEMRTALADYERLLRERDELRKALQAMVVHIESRQAIVERGGITGSLRFELQEIKKRVLKALTEQPPAVSE